MTLTMALPAILAVAFEKPSTHDFVWSCYVGHGYTCFNFIMLLLVISVVAFLLMFYTAFRNPQIVPGKWQAAMEGGVQFVREQVVMQMIGPQGIPFLAFLATLFFWIVLGNILEVVPGINFPLNSRLAFPLVMAIVAWVVYNYVGVKRHGLLGYLKLVLFPPGIPPSIFGRFVLKPFLALIEFFSVIIVRPFTLTVRLTANMIAGHFLLATFFLGTIVLFTGIPYVLGAFSFTLAVVMVAFEIFVAVLQAFIFAVLTASYIAGAMATEH
jgi:F-type H+-transporting ATPase subunit a